MTENTTTTTTTVDTDKAAAALARRSEAWVKRVDGSAGRVDDAVVAWLGDIAEGEEHGYWKVTGAKTWKEWLTDHMAAHPIILAVAPVAAIQKLSKAGVSVRKTQAMFAEAGVHVPSNGTVQNAKEAILNPLTGQPVKPNEDPITGKPLVKPPVTEADRAKAERERANKLPGRAENLTKAYVDVAHLLGKDEHAAMGKALSDAMVAWTTQEAKRQGKRARSGSQGTTGRTGTVNPAPSAPKPGPVAQAAS